MKNRVPRIRESTVRIFVSGQPAGSGFITQENGGIVTCFHVVQQVNPGQGNQVQITTNAFGISKVILFKLGNMIDDMVWIYQDLKALIFAGP